MASQAAAAPAEAAPAVAVLVLLLLLPVIIIVSMAVIMVMIIIMIVVVVIVDVLPVIFPHRFFNRGRSMARARRQRPSAPRFRVGRSPSRVTARSPAQRINSVEMTIR
jgi:hypothetical protein